MNDHTQMRPVLGYCRVSTEMQGEQGYGIEAQRERIQAEVDRRGWTLAETYIDVGSGGSTRRRPQLQTALDQLREGHAHALVVAKLDRLSRSVIDFAGMMAQAQREGWSIVALDLGVDTSTVNGELVASLIMALAQWERRIIGERTRDALAVARNRGVTLGRPVTTPLEAESLIRVLRASGQSLGEVARQLNSHDVPTAHGGARWYASTVRAVEQRLAS